MEVVDPARRPARVAFAERMLRLREAYGRRLGQKMPQIRFADLLGITQAAYARYEKGDAFPNSDVLEAIRNVTGCSLDALIAGVQPGSTSLLGELVKPPTSADRFRYVRELKDARDRGSIMSGDWDALIRELTGEPGMADRIRWVRQIKEPDEEKAAEVLGLSVEGLQAIEDGSMKPTWEKATEFATRFGITLDFLARGSTAGIQDQDLLLTLLDQHPSLGEEKKSSLPGKRRESGGGSIDQPRKVAQAI